MTPSAGSRIVGEPQNAVGAAETAAGDGERMTGGKYTAGRSRIVEGTRTGVGGQGRARVDC